MTVLVTGTAGFIGPVVLEELKKRGYEKVYGLDREPAAFDKLASTHFQVDILDYDKLKAVFDKIKPDGIIHLAARTDIYGTKLEDYADNIGAVENICRAASETPSVKRVIYTSTKSVCKNGYTPKSDDDYCPVSVYGESKIETERIVREMDGGGVEWVLLRPSALWGPRMYVHYQKMLRMIRRGLYFHVGNEKVYKSYGYVDNIAYQFVQFLEAPIDKIFRKTFYLADYEKLAVHDYTNGLAKAMGARKIPVLPAGLVWSLAAVGDFIKKIGFSKFPFTSYRLNNVVTPFVYDMTQTKEVCGDYLPASHEEGIKATAEWFLKQENG